MQEEVLETKKIVEEGQLVGGAVVAIVALIVGVAISILMLIFTGALAGQTWNLVESDIDTIGNNFVLNESFTALNSTAVALAGTPTQAGTLVVVNGSDLVGATSYSFDLATSEFTLSNFSYNNSAFGANYTWGDPSIGNSIKSSVVSGFEALEQTGNYLPLVVLAVITALIIGIILSFANFGNLASGSGKGSVL